MVGVTPERNTKSTVDTIVKQGLIREQHIAKFGFAILDRKAIELLRGYAPLLEVGAGSGYWSYELKKAGVDVVATDPGTGKYAFTEDGKKGYTKWKPWTEIEELDANAAIAKYPKRNLLTVWPDYQELWSAAMLGEFKGQYVCYVGEGDGGCTASDEFHAILKAEYTDVADQHIPQFNHIHDRLTIYKKGLK
jgi:hypothetical protein